MLAELVEKVVEQCGWRTEEFGEGVVRLMGGRPTPQRLTAPGFGGAAPLPQEGVWEEGLYSYSMIL